MKKALLAVLTISFIGFSQAKASDDCSYIDLRQQLPVGMKQFFSTPRNQSGLGWCFAYTAADLLSYRLAKPLSAFDLGLVYSGEVSQAGSFFRNMFGNTKAGLNEGGDIRSALEVSQKRGALCSEEAIRSNGSLFDNLGSGIENIRSVIDGQGNEFMALDFLRHRFPKSNAVDILSYLKGTSSADINKSLLEVNKNVCKKEFSPISSELEFQSTVNKNSADYISILNSILNSGIPVGMDYRPQAMLNPEMMGENMKSFSAAFLEHASVIVGRQKMGNKCMYAVRNSWGSDCSVYRSDVKCDEKAGIFFMSADEISTYSTQVTYISN